MMMPTVSPSRPTASPLGVASATAVREDLLSTLRSHGLPSPLRGLNDPRLAYPEMLLMNGWERVERPAGCAYEVVAEDGGQHEYYAQRIELSADGTCRLETYSGRLVQSIASLPDGRVRSQIRSV